ncbi:isopenicillin N synthase family oxygenase [Flavobacteriaceae bacterium AU392]|nr:isopenicillin N synthase family oxygenase [Flavobacteriaceae bacterium]RKM83601.1 isopenicillin N synthase family oxygenase [Flavobacteriaceae bacterium AU392]
MAKNKEDGIHAINQEFNKYEGVNKDHEYGLVENETVDQFDEDFVIQTCDMREFFEGGEEGKKAFAKKLGSALEEIGFAVLSGHGVETELYNLAESKVEELFKTVSLKERMAYEAQRHGSVNQGYFPIKETTKIHPDLVEGWVFCRRAFDLPDNSNYNESDYWPKPNFEPVFRQVVQSHEKLILPIMQSILSYLGCYTHLYDEKLSATNFGFRLNYYPAVSKEDDASGAGRMLGHEDIDLFTILPAQSVDGLQVYNRANGKWIRLNPDPGTIILNTGDYMQRITNDRLPSTTHRVSKPKEANLLNKSRITIPMAIYLWEDEILEVLPGLTPVKYKPISAIKFHTGITSKYYGDDYAVDK